MIDAMEHAKLWNRLGGRLGLANGTDATKFRLCNNGAVIREPRPTKLGQSPLTRERFGPLYEKTR